MHLNARTAVTGQNVVFVPYRREHVEIYRRWLHKVEGRAEELLEIEQDYMLPNVWQEDEDTFVAVVLAAPRDRQASDLTDQEIKALPTIGIVRLFLHPGNRGRMAEVMIFIAEAAFIRAGYDYDTLGLLLSYATSTESGLHLAPYNFYVRIPVVNEPFKSLFRKYGFDQEKPVPEHPEYIELSAGRVSWDGDFDLRDWPS